MHRSKRKLKNEEEGHNLLSVEDTKKIKDAILANHKKIDDLRMDNLSLYSRYEDMGGNKKGLKKVVKEIKCPTTDDEKEAVNYIRDQLGHLPLFAGV